MKIGQLSDATGVTTSTIRYYDSLGLLGEVKRTSGTTRRFDQQSVLRVALIKGLQNMGFSLKQIPMFFQTPNTPIDHQHILETIDQKIAESDKLILQLKSQKEKMTTVKQKLASTWGKGDCLTNEQLDTISQILS